MSDAQEDSGLTACYALGLAGDLDGGNPTRIGTTMKAVKIIGLMVALAVSFAHVRTCSAEAAPAFAIRQVLDDQAAAWNRGDVEAFMRAYKDSPDTTFIGKSVAQGYRPILERYKKTYSSKDAMGTLTFRSHGAGVRRELRCRDGKISSGAHRCRWRRCRAASSRWFGRRRQDGWKIILDHTSATP